MRSSGAALARALAGAALLVVLAYAHPGAFSNRFIDAQQPPTRDEVRAMWVLRSSLSSPANIAALVRSAKRHGFNTLLVQVRGRGDAYYAATIEPRAAELLRQPGSFDPLLQLLTAAHAADLRVHAWINVNLVASATYLPSASEHLVSRHPEWLMVPRELAGELARISPSHPRYVRTLAAWTRKHSSEVEGLYASPLHPEAIDHVGHVVSEVVRRYPVDGVHFDYVRYPSERFDYSRGAIRAFRASIEGQLPPARRRQLTARDAHDLFAFPDGLPDEWRRFRMSRVTAVVSRLRNIVKAERPGMLVSVAVAPDVREALDGRLQDWPRWLEEGLVDAICPMAYTTERTRFAEQISAAITAAGDRQVWAGIGAYRMSPQQTIANIATARRLGAGGIILFSYDSLVNNRHPAADYLSLVGRAAFTNKSPNSTPR